jgi:transcriptional regulator with XRE-family HTH domain
MERSFGTVLRSLIEQEYGTQEECARKLGQTRGWISQAMSKGNLTHTSLIKILNAFPDPAHQDQLYRAWRATHAPAPAVLSAQELLRDNDQRDAFLRGGPYHYEHGRAQGVLRMALALWSDGGLRASDASAAFRAARLAIDCSYLLDRPALGLRLCEDLLDWSRARQEPHWVATALWLRSLGLRALSSASHLGQLAEDLPSYLSQWQPRSPKETLAHRQLQVTLRRDRLVALWQKATYGQSAAGELTAHVKTYLDGLRDCDDSIARGLGFEVASRAWALRGHIDAAHECLDASRALIGGLTPLVDAKLQMSSLRVEIAEGSLAGAERTLGAARLHAERFHLPHYQRQAAVFEETLYLAELARSSRTKR